MAQKVALNSLNCLLSEMRPLGLLNPTGVVDGEGIEGIGDTLSATNYHELFMGTLSSCMRLDSAAADAVMLLPDKRGPRKVE